MTSVPPKRRKMVSGSWLPLGIASKMNFRTLVHCLILLYGSSKALPTDSDRILFEDEDEEFKSCESVTILPRIVGGSTVISKYSTPYIVAVGELLSNGSIVWYCGGSIVSENHVLTAAHCVATRNIDVVRIGSLVINRRHLKNDYPVSKTFIHPDYDPPRSYHDVAVIRLREDIPFSEKVKPICLAEKDEEYLGRRARVIGWGAEEVGGDGVHRLKKVQVEVVSNRKCDEAYRNSSVSTRTFPDGIRVGQLCAGSQEGGKDACQGDSGGPLVMKGEDDITMQVGIVSTGAGCGASAYPGVYARVSTYHSWIKDVIRNSSERSLLKNVFGRQ